MGTGQIPGFSIERSVLVSADLDPIYFSLDQPIEGVDCGEGWTGVIEKPIFCSVIEIKYRHEVVGIDEWSQA